MRTTAILTICALLCALLGCGSVVVDDVDDVDDAGGEGSVDVDDAGGEGSVDVDDAGEQHDCSISASCRDCREDAWSRTFNLVPGTTMEILLISTTREVLTVHGQGCEYQSWDASTSYSCTVTEPGTTVVDVIGVSTLFWHTWSIEISATCLSTP